MQSISLIEILLISVGLSADAFSVALAGGAQGFKPRRIFRLSWHFGLFQFLMPLIGWYGGELIAKNIGQTGNYIALVILTIIGGKMIIEGFNNNPAAADLSRGWKLISLSIGTSLDALAVGFSLALVGVGIFLPAIIIGLVCASMTILGLFLGVCLYNRIGQRALIVGGLILIGIGIKMII